MSNPTEQPIDPDKQGVYCDVCEMEVFGIKNWQNHLDSKEHKSKLEL